MNIVELVSYFTLPINDLEPERGKFLWLTRLRWFYIILLFHFIIFQFFIYPEIIEKKVILLWSFFLLFTVNILCHSVLKLNQNKINEWWVYALLIFDLLFFTFLCSLLKFKLSLPVENIFFIHVALGGILLTQGRGISFYCITAVLSFYISVHLNFLNLKSNDYFLGVLFNQLISFSIFTMANSISIQLIGQREKMLIIKLNAEKIDRLRAIGALSAGFSHEFASPLSTIKLKLKRLQRKKEFDESDIDIAVTEAENCENILKKINSSQLDKRDFIFQRINIEKYLSVIIENWKKEKDKFEVYFHSDISNPFISVPVINLTQSVLYLLDNAYEAPEASQVEIILKENSGLISIEVKDNGLGFSEDVLSRKGEPFVTSKSDGTGLGLYSVLNFCLSINGELELKNNNGALVKVIFPRIQDEAL